MLKRLLMAVTVTSMVLIGTAQADNSKPGKGVTVRPARATWNTGFFQEAIVHKGLEELGYKVKKAKDLSVPIFYKALSLGDLDYWTNGWFPMHEAEVPKGFYEKAEKVGYVLKAGGLQGYLVSKEHVDKYGITSLEDFKRDEVKKAFDKNGDGKADLTACPPGWGCEGIISHHMEVYGLADSVNPITASYEAGMASALAEYKAGEPIFFYTWAPNWTIFKLKPGQDVMWINVPETLPTEAQMLGKDRMEVSGIEGGVSDPVKLGFVVSDIQIVANKTFMADNPAATKFFELFTLSLTDVNEQSTKMNEGEKSQKDIERHADEWIAKNSATWNSWLDEARKAAK
jgi:glycine betaine/proline transport system substrate-binding protein